MMITDIEIKTCAYHAIKDSALASMVNGKICRDKRDINSGQEDITINVLETEGTQLQRAIIIVNVYVKDLYVNGQYLTDEGRIMTLARECISLLEKYHTKEFAMHLRRQSIIENEAAHEHVISNKIRFITLNS